MNGGKGEGEPGGEDLLSWSKMTPLVWKKKFISFVRWEKIKELQK